MLSKPTAMQFIVLLGLVSLFADMTYEGARSIVGQYLAILGASGAVVGCVAGFGEFIGYGFRLVSGYFSDKTGKYWLFTGIGYAINLLAVPLLALAGNWQIAAALVIMERFGKALRSPAKDAMLSYATQQVGRGWGFGLHEAMDQIGAILGPLIVSAILYYKSSYTLSFAYLLIPALSALAVLAVARTLYPRPEELEINTPQLKAEGIGRTFWLYMAAICFVAAGYVDFPLMAFHFKKADILTDAWIPVLFAVAMGAAGIASLILGRLYDKYGLTVLLYAIPLSALFVPLVFFNLQIEAGIILWGVGLGTQESIMRAYVAQTVEPLKRGTAYGLMNSLFGLSWFAGSAVIGFLYDLSIPTLVIFSFALQLFSIPLLVVVRGQMKKN